MRGLSGTCTCYSGSCMFHLAGTYVRVASAARRLLEAHDDDSHPLEVAAAAAELRNALYAQGLLVYEALEAKDGYDE